MPAPSGNRTDGTRPRRPRWRLVLGIVLVVLGAAVYVVLELAREDHTGISFNGVLGGLLVALGIVVLQRPQR